GKGDGKDEALVAAQDVDKLAQIDRVLDLHAHHGRPVCERRLMPIRFHRPGVIPSNQIRHRLPYDQGDDRYDRARNAARGRNVLPEDGDAPINDDLVTRLNSPVTQGGIRVCQIEPVLDAITDEAYPIQARAVCHPARQPDCLRYRHLWRQGVQVRLPHFPAYDHLHQRLDDKARLCIEVVKDFLHASLDLGLRSTDHPHRPVDRVGDVTIAGHRELAGQLVVAVYRDSDSVAGAEY